MDNLGGSQFCDECGATLNNRNNGEIVNAADTPNFGGFAGFGEMASFQTRASEIPVFQSSNVTSVGIPAISDAPEEIAAEKEIPVEKEISPKAKGINATLIIERGDSVGTEFTLAADESNIGRWDADNGIFPDVDLDAHDSEAKISRRHARIIHENGRFMIEDLGSTNGTYINRGRRLIPGSPQLLNDGDEIIVGKTFLRFYRNE